MRTTEEGVALIKEFEGCSLTAYRDCSPARLWTIGYGCTRGVSPDMKITQGEAEALLFKQIEVTEAILLRCVPEPALTDNQLSALVSFCYNVGFGHIGVKDGFQVLKSGQPSTLLQCLLSGDFANAAAEFPKWDHIGGVESAGIARRRAAEQALFLKPGPKEAGDGGD